jgi:hypothetical protein
MWFRILLIPSGSFDIFKAASDGGIESAYKLTVRKINKFKGYSNVPEFRSFSEMKKFQSDSRPSLEVNAIDLRRPVAEKKTNLAKIVKPSERSYYQTEYRMPALVRSSIR